MNKHTRRQPLFCGVCKAEIGNAEPLLAFPDYPPSKTFLLFNQTLSLGVFSIHEGKIIHMVGEEAHFGYTIGEGLNRYQFGIIAWCPMDKLKPSIRNLPSQELRYRGT